MEIHWKELFALQTPILDLVLRGTAVYVGLFILLRVIMKREAGALTVSDLLVAVLLGNAVQNALLGDSTSIADAFVLVIVIIGWNYLLNWLNYRFPGLQSLTSPPAVLLIENGKLIRKNMRKELITEDELSSQLRLHGLEQFSEVKEAYMEGDGNISMVPFERGGLDKPEGRSQWGG